MGGGGGGGRGVCNNEYGLVAGCFFDVMFEDCTGYLRKSVLFGVAKSFVGEMDGCAINVKFMFF